MAFMTNPRQRLQMIEQALKDQAPRLYRELKKAGHLPQFLQERDDLMMDTYDQIYAELKTSVLQPSQKEYLPRLQALTSAQNRAWEETMATWLEFSDEEPEPEQTMSSPQAP